MVLLLVSPTPSTLIPVLQHNSNLILVMDAGNFTASNTVITIDKIKMFCMEYTN